MHVCLYASEADFFRYVSAWTAADAARAEATRIADSVPVDPHFSAFRRTSPHIAATFDAVGENICAVNHTSHK